MMQSTKLSKLGVVLATTLFTAATFASTCPALDQIKIGQGPGGTPKYTAANNWVGVPANGLPLPGESITGFAGATVYGVTPSNVPGQQMEGNSTQCRYFATKGTSVRSITLSRTALVFIYNERPWRRGKPNAHSVYSCTNQTLAPGDVNYCEFGVISGKSVQINPFR